MIIQFGPQGWRVKQEGAGGRATMTERRALALVLRTAQLVGREDIAMACLRVKTGDFYGIMRSQELLDRKERALNRVWCENAAKNRPIIDLDFIRLDMSDPQTLVDSVDIGPADETCETLRFLMSFFLALASEGRVGGQYVDRVKRLARLSDPLLKTALLGNSTLVKNTVTHPVQNVHDPETLLLTSSGLSAQSVYDPTKCEVEEAAGDRGLCVYGND